MRRRKRKNYTFKRSVFEPPIPKASRGSENKVSACNTGDLGLTPGSGRPPGEGNGNLLQDSRLENPMDRGAWWAAVHGVTESDTTQRLHILFFPKATPEKMVPQAPTAYSERQALSAVFQSLTRSDCPVGSCSCCAGAGLRAAFSSRANLTG